MNKKLLYAVIPVLGIGFLTAGSALAHGIWGGAGSADEFATRRQTAFEHQAQVLGVSADVVKNGWAQGKTLQEIAQDNGLTQEQMQERMAQARQTFMQERLQAMVDKGIITQDQANQRLEFMKEHQAQGPPEERGRKMGWDR